MRFGKKQSQKKKTRCLKLLQRVFLEKHVFFFEFLHVRKTPVPEGSRKEKGGFPEVSPEAF